MKIRTKRAWIGMGAVLALAVSPTAVLAEPAADDTDKDVAAQPATVDGDIVTLDLYNLTDIHGHIEKVVDERKGNKVTEAGLEAMKCYFDNAVKENPDSQITLLGDNIGASPFVSGILLDNPTIAALNELKPLASTIGNHELDLGQEVFKARAKKEGETTGTAPVNGEMREFIRANFPYLGANVEGLGEALGDYSIWESPSGVKVAYIGAIAEDVPYKLSPGTTEGMTFHDPIAKINTLAGELKASGEADIVVAMLDDDVKNNFPKMGKNVDALMGGDTHVVYTFTMVDGAEGNKLSATASGSYTDNLANIRVTYDKTAKKVVKSEAQSIPAAEVAKCDTPNSIGPIVADAKEKSKKEGAKVVASGVPNAFYRAVHQDSEGAEISPGSNRGHESSLGDLVADAMKEKILTTAGEPVDIGIINAGGLRKDLVPVDGNLTYKQTYDVMPFSNQVGYVTITGADFKQALEEQWKTDLNSQNSRPMLKLGISSNVSYTYDPALPYGSRITSVLLDGKPMDMAKKYTVGSVTFLLAGGDSFKALTNGGDYAIIDDYDRDKFNEYLAEHPGVKPRAIKSSVGVSLPQGTVDGETFGIDLRGLSFTEGPSKTESVTVKVGDQTVKAAVDNSIVEPNANSPESIITTDGAGQASLTVTSPLVECPGAEDVVKLPVTIEGDFGELVSAEHGLVVEQTCTRTAPEPTEEPTVAPTVAPTQDPTVAPTAAPVPPKPGLPITGSEAAGLGVITVALLMAGGAALAVRRRMDAS
ncbi:MAG: 5'-nucleotidase C-terminal domain-containing protein [Bowdeniella nasicola]|nr:5'-nucleotidase C-terminal domain-containing protein [Bowdeniella nasicola]